MLSKEKYLIICGIRKGVVWQVTLQPQMVIDKSVLKCTNEMSFQPCACRLLRFYETIAELYG